MNINFGIIGAGVVGLNTALELQKEYPNATITIIADRFETDTTSAAAAGIFRPGLSFSGPTPEITQQWINDAYAYWDDIRKSPEASTAGVTQLSGYIFSSLDPGIVRNHYIEQLLPIYRQVDESELTLCPGNWKYGSFFTTILAECTLYLPWAMNKFTSSGGDIIKSHPLESFIDLQQQTKTARYDIIINCTGLGARKLCNDFKMVPIRGQILKVHAPWVKTAFYADYDTYIIPGFNSVVSLGGCRQYDSYNMNICKYDGMAIRERCEELLPSLKDAPIVREVVGLRPHRDTVRVELEYLETTSAVGGSTAPLKIIHNYGHGGYGVTTSPGTAKYTVKLIKDVLRSSGHYNSSKL